MSRSINFVQDRRKRQSVTQLEDQRLFRYALLGFGVALALSLAAFGAQFYFSHRVEALVADQDRVKQEISAQQEFEQTYTLFAKKIGVLADLFDKRRNKQEAIAFFAQVFGPDVVVKQIVYTDKEHELSFDLEAKSVFVLDRVFATLQLPEVTERFATVHKASLDRTSDGKYTMTITVPLASQGKEHDV